MTIGGERTANALGGKTARACDSCLRRRARWFCAADDAFLCQTCDASVHSANQLASRHERVRLETSSFKSSKEDYNHENSPVWHQGFTRKARTPRHKSEKKFLLKPALPLVPEIGSDESNSPDHENEDQQEQLLFRVPIFEPFAADEVLCIETGHDHHQVENMQSTGDDEGAELFITGNEFDVLLNDDDERYNLHINPEFIASDVELAELAAEVESLLGTGHDEDSCGIEGLGSEIESKEENGFGDNKRVKIEDEDEVQAVIACHFDPALDSARESMNWDFDYSSTAMSVGEEEEMKFTIEMPMTDFESKAEEKRNIFLKLNYEAVITEWASQGCPWTNGMKPDFSSNDCWPDFMGSGSETFQPPYGGRSGCRDEDREARVSRYREKRRNRLFSKKIRYEVRKLNAEKRPRMKGRFVKRTSFAAPNSNFPHLMNNK